MSQWLIVGLGNPGEKYRATRHNVGFDVVEELVRRKSLGAARLECNALIWRQASLTLAAPQTYMNRSGFSVRCLVEKHGLEPARTVVVYDDVHLELGRVRLRGKGGPGGHRGMESVVENLRSEEIPRLRLGVGDKEPPPGGDLARFVLERFRSGERSTAAEMTQRGADAIECLVTEGLQAGMNKFN